MGGISSVLHRAWRIYPDFVLGTGNEAFSKALKNTVKNRGKDVNYFTSVWNGIKDGAKAAEKHNKDVIKLRGGFFESLWHDLKTTPKKIAQGWRIGGQRAQKAGKEGFSKYWASFKGAGNGLMKRMPLIGSLMIIGFELPNIFRATADEGIFSGLVETAKAGLRLGAGMTGAAIGQALIPIPVLGGLVGYIAGDSLMGLFTGKSYTEKKEKVEQLAQVTDKADQNYEEAMKQYLALQQSNSAANPYAASQASLNMPKATMTPQQVAMLGSQLYNSTTTDLMNQDFMKLTSGMTNGINYLG